MYWRGSKDICAVMSKSNRNLTTAVCLSHPDANSSNSNLAEFRSKTWASQYIGFAGIFEFLLQGHGSDIAAANHLVLFTPKTTKQPFMANIQDNLF